MNILIIGCGEAGCYLARKLEDYGQDVAVLDQDQKNLDRLQDYGHSPFKGVTFCGVCIDIDVLRSSGIEECDVVLALTEDDNVNVMVAQVAQEIFKVNKVLASIQDPALKEVFANHLNVVTVSPTTLLVNMLTNIILEEKFPYNIPIGKECLHFKPINISSKYEGLDISHLDYSNYGVLIGVLDCDGEFTMANEQNKIIRKNDVAIIAETK